MSVRTRARRAVARARHVARKLYEPFYVSKLPPALATVAGRVRADGLTYLSPRKLDKLALLLGDIEARGVKGAVLEAGCALGGSAILLAHARTSARPLRVYDVFGMIPAPSDNDGEDVHARYRVIASGQSKGLKGQRYYGYENDLVTRVKNNFKNFGKDVDVADNDIALVVGKVEDTLVVDDAVAFAHVDVDWYDPVLCCLERIAPKLAVGGVIVLDDYFDWSGSREATDAFLKRTPIRFKKDAHAGSLALIRTA